MMLVSREGLLGCFQVERGLRGVLGGLKFLEVFVEGVDRSC